MNSQSLAQRYRPVTFGDVVGQQMATTLLQAMVQREALPAVLMFSGSKGVGKTTLGRMIAAALNCEVDPGHRPCGKCGTCLSVQQGTFLAVHEIDGATHGGVAEIRTLREKVSLSSGQYHRVVLLDEAQAMSREANSALLGLLEEPPPNVTFILLTTEPGKILDTVRSRLVQIEFSRISAADIIARLEHISEQEGFEIEKRLFLPIAERAQGALRDALMQLDTLTRAGITTLEGFTSLYGEPDVGPLLLRAVLSGDMATVARESEALLLRKGDAASLLSAMISTLRDVLVLLVDEHALTNQTAGAVAARHSLAKELGTAGAYKAMALIYQLGQNTIAGGDPRALLDLSMTMMVELLNNQKLSNPPVAGSAPERVSLGDMQ